MTPLVESLNYRPEAFDGDVQAQGARYGPSPSDHSSSEGQRSSSEGFIIAINAIRAICAIVVTGLVQSAAGSASHRRCLDAAPVDALKLLRFHVQVFESREYSNPQIDVAPPPRVTTRRDPRYPRNNDIVVVDLGGFYINTEYSIRLTYVFDDSACVLVGQEVIQSSLLSLRGRK
jgi:hypothetical protein